MDAHEASWRAALDQAAVTNVGMRRANNQDSYVVVTAADRHEWLRRGHLFMVADGMGAHAAGELASKMATDFISHSYYKSPDESPVDAIGRAFQDANERIYARGQSNPDFRGMGTTGSVLLLLPEGAVVAHVGDSRVYRLRGYRFEQLSFDHSLVWEMQASGKFRGQESTLNIPKNIITRSLGPSLPVQVDLEGPFPLEVGDVFLLCSDGLSGQVDDDEMGVVLEALPPQDAAAVLVDLANLRGGPDNITVIVARVAGQELVDGGAGTDETPAAARTPPGRNAVHPASWIGLGVLALVTLSMAFVGQWWVAATTGIAALVVAAFIAGQYLNRAGGSARVDGGKLGQGPHRSTLCTANPAVVEKLAKVVKQLRDAAAEEQWQVDWERFNGYAARALAAGKQQDYLQAVREHCHAITFMMNELREQARRNGTTATKPTTD